MKPLAIESNPRLIAIDAQISAFVDANVRCQTCAHSIEEDLFNCYCEHPEGSAMAQGWNSKPTCCECHDFKDPLKNLELEKLQDQWIEIYTELEEVCA